MCAGSRADGSKIEANDPFWNDLNEVAIATKDDPRAWLMQRQYYGDLAEEPRFADAFALWLSKIWDLGTEAALDAYLAR